MTGAAVQHSVAVQPAAWSAQSIVSGEAWMSLAWSSQSYAVFDESPAPAVSAQVFEGAAKNARQHMAVMAGKG